MEVFDLALNDISWFIKSEANQFTYKHHDIIIMTQNYFLRDAYISGVSRAFPGGRLAHPEGQNEEENK